LLFVEDDALLVQAARDHLAADGIEVVGAHTIAEATAILDGRTFDVVVLDQRLPDGEGHTLCDSILKSHPSAKIVFVTAFPTLEDAVVARKAGAHDHLSKPFDLEELRHSVRRTLAVRDLEKLERVQELHATRESQASQLAGGAALAEVRRLVEIAACSTSPVLITGETGTGKNLVAKIIHHAGTRASRPFLGLHLASMPESLVEAELFGWDRGALMGAVASREGLVELAEGGTLFLDEIEEMPMHLQAKLLTLLEEREVRRLGGRGARTADVRFVTATNADLDERVAEKRFLADLRGRLDALRIHVPPLRERLDDLDELCRELLARMSSRSRAPRLASGELARLARYAWPGNVRELRNVLERACLLHGDPIRPSELLAVGAPRDPHATPSTPMPRHGASTSHRAPSAATLDEIERRHVEETFRACGGNLAQTARALGISLSTLKRKARRFGLRDVRSS
jgi:DNA-binding NtrC family response regulator